SERTSTRSSTLFMMAISENEVILDAISAALGPVYVQTTVISGLSTRGRISVDIRCAAITPKSRIAIARTAIEYL
ncbi:MAG TPA: hypothetical protein VFI76_07540, partial [Terrimicrobiaceae bacterium]|nr:hypothetical protein [Terrimicrobiaceae bacterium]